MLGVRLLRPWCLCLGMRECDLCHKLAVKPFASVILSSVGVSLHLFQAQLLPTDRMLRGTAGASVYPSPRCGVSPAAYLCGLVQCVCCALHRAAEQSWSVPLMSRVVIRLLPWRNMQVAWVEEDAAARFPVCALAVLGPGENITGTCNLAQRTPSMVHAFGPHSAPSQECHGRLLKVRSTSAQRTQIPISISKDLTASGAPWSCWNPLHSLTIEVCSGQLCACARRAMVGNAFW